LVEPLDIGPAINIQHKRGIEKRSVEGTKEEEKLASLIIRL